MKWTDVYDIAIELEDAHPEQDPLRVNFVGSLGWMTRRK